MKKCISCNTEEKNLNYVKNRNVYVCDECLSKKYPYTKCMGEDCDAIVDIRQDINCITYSDDRHYLCDDCFKLKQPVECPYCSDTYIKEDTVEIDGKIVCKYCCEESEA